MTTNREKADAAMRAKFPGASFVQLSRRDRLFLLIQELVHPLGVHSPIRTFSWDERLSRLIDEGKVCRVCGIECH